MNSLVSEMKPLQEVFEKLRESLWARLTFSSSEAVLSSRRWKVSRVQRELLQLIHHNDACVYCGLQAVGVGIILNGEEGLRPRNFSNVMLRVVAWDDHLESWSVFDRDHIKARSMGGVDAHKNLQVTCEPCNSHKMENTAPPQPWLEIRKEALCSPTRR